MNDYINEIKSIIPHVVNKVLLLELILLQTDSILHSGVNLSIEKDVPRPPSKCKYNLIISSVHGGALRVVFYLSTGVPEKWRINQLIVVLKRSQSWNLSVDT